MASGRRSLGARHGAIARAAACRSVELDEADVGRAVAEREDGHGGPEIKAGGTGRTATRTTGLAGGGGGGPGKIPVGGGKGGKDDSRKDGVTNPTPVEGNRGEQSTWPDDDGGYLRMRAGPRYRSPVLFDIRPARR